MKDGYGLVRGHGEHADVFMMCWIGPYRGFDGQESSKIFEIAAEMLDMALHLARTTRTSAAKWWYQFKESPLAKQVTNSYHIPGITIHSLFPQRNPSQDESINKY
jgi:hypothetical protein